MLRFASKVLLFVLIGVHVEFSKSSNLPSFITPCYRDDPNLQDCLLKEGKKILKRFVQGIPELGVVSMDPLQLGDFEIKHNSLDIYNKNAVMGGFKDAHLLDLFIDIEKKTGRCRLTGNSSFDADYEIDGKILLLPITGAGKSSLKMVNFDLLINWNWALKKGNDGKEYAFITHATNSIDMENLIINMSGLFNDNKFLGDAMNKILNANWRLLLREVAPPSIKVVQQTIINIFNKFYEKVPYDELFPVSKQ